MSAGLLASLSQPKFRFSQQIGHPAYLHVKGTPSAVLMAGAATCCFGPIIGGVYAACLEASSIPLPFFVTKCADRLCGVPGFAGIRSVVHVLLWQFTHQETGRS
jgi:hypothetical protein